MDKFEQKYGIEEDEETQNFHRSRRMFCVIDNVLYLADQNLPCSHAVWFEKEGWMTKDNDGIMKEITRGIVDDKGDVYFYVGYDFSLDEKTQNTFFSHLKELVDKLNLDPDSNIFGGLVKLNSSGKWPPIKDFGKIKNNL